MESFSERIGYTFKNPELFREAVTHSSYVNGKNHSSNERLEFLGDSVLSIVVSEYLFTNLPDYPEGRLTKIRASLVCEQSLFGFAKKIKLGDEILLGKGEENTGGRERRSILADCFEALIAAIFLDGGIDEAKKFVMKFLPTQSQLKNEKNLLGDYKTVLQEIIQKNPEERISYFLADEQGEAHQRTFTSQVLLNNQVIGTGSGNSKKEAEQMAAREAIQLMGYETD